jgi:ABC-type cobalamin transport system permease subunit
MSQVNEGRSLPDLVGGLAGDFSTLVRKEVQLAKAEASEKLDVVLAGAIALLTGGVLALGALGVLLSAIVSIIAAVLINQGMDPTMATALAAGIVTIVAGLIGWMFISRGLKTLKASNLNLERTTHSLGRDAEAVKERL